MIRILTLLATLFAGSVQAQEPSQVCGAPAAPCEIPGGFYHAALPDGDIRGAMVFLHGYGGRAAATIANSGLMNAFNARGYAVIAVQGMPRRPGDTGGSWNSMARSAPQRDDVAFISAAADDAAYRFDFARENTLLAGFSGGGMMTWRVACDAPNSFAAYAPVAGTFWRPLPLDCAGPVRIFHTHGTSDTVVPLAGRTVGSGITQGDVFETLENQRSLHGCTADFPGETAQIGQFSIERWAGCSKSDEIALALHSGGHTIPNGWSGMILDWYDALH